VLAPHSLPLSSARPPLPPIAQSLHSCARRARTRVWPRRGRRRANVVRCGTGRQAGCVCGRAWLRGAHPRRVTHHAARHHPAHLRPGEHAARVVAQVLVRQQRRAVRRAARVLVPVGGRSVDHGLMNRRGGGGAAVRLLLCVGVARGHQARCSTHADACMRDARPDASLSTLPPNTPHTPARRPPAAHSSCRSCT
jgi:hypothetical protein